ncbi:NAD-dependent epimerase/dehydratase family protein [Sinomonas notoginsengisoli]|uniref:NAD-dependent epimerase/dehydratase family protein n=1 Tax=Sinomonas notoginsengisoli TaxID=1457311 RepID=UPI001F4778A1|nr:NAD-dependent epimerase/dehydratase family protein [Sinomonas notoginsengisoli]
MQRYAVIGSGVAGWTVAQKLAQQGERAKVITRSGNGPAHPLIDLRAVDVNDGALLARELDGTSAVFYTLSTAYSAAAWARELPRAQRSVLDAAEAAGAVVVFVENLYAYPRPDLPMAEDSERNAVGGKRGVRAQLIRERQAHPARSASVAASDFFGPRVLASHAGDRMLPRILAGKPLDLIGSADQPHTFTYVQDLAVAMIAVARDPKQWGRMHHAPSLPALSQRELAAAFAHAAGVELPPIRVLPAWLVRAGGLVVPLLREVGETAYQFARPFVMDSSITQDRLGLAPTALEEAASATVAWWRSRA